MPHVVPTDIVKLAADIRKKGSVSAGRPVLIRPQVPEISALIDLTEELPTELLLLSGNEYSSYRISLQRLKDLTKWWHQVQLTGRDQIDSSFAVSGASAIATIEQLLAKCPDESPSPSTAELTFISDDELRNSIRTDISAANRALHDGLWKASTVLAGSVAEALLRWRITERKTPTEIEATRAAVVPSANRDIDFWDLNHYIKVAATFGLIEAETATQADLAREFRNLIHPGRSARLSKVCDRGTALSALAAVELIVRDLS